MQYELPSMTVDFEHQTQFHNLRQQSFGKLYSAKHLHSSYYTSTQTLLIRHPLPDEFLRIEPKSFRSLHNFHPLSKVLQGTNLDKQPKAIQELRPQIPFLRIARADKNKPRRVPYTQTLPLHNVDPHHRHIQQQVDQVIFEQVDFINIEKTTMRLGEQTRLKRPFPTRERRLNV